MRPCWQLVLAEAERIAEGSNVPHLYPRDAYGSAMLDLAASDARAGETAASSLSRLWATNDSRIAHLHKAYECAPLAPEVGKRADIAEIMNCHARRHQRGGESFEQAFDRLCATDDTMRHLHKVYTGATA